MDYDGNDARDCEMMISKQEFYPRGSCFQVSEFFEILVRNDILKKFTHKEFQKTGILMICFLPMPLRWSTADKAIVQSVSLLSSEMHAFGDFRLVIVFLLGEMEMDTGIGDFDHDFPSFSTIAFTRACEISASLNLDLTPVSAPTGMLVNRNQTVEWHKPLNFLLGYGVDAFPFTPEILAMITDRDEWDKETLMKSWIHPVNLLCSPLLPFPKCRSFLYKNPGGGMEKKTIFEIGDMCVGLYVCLTGNLIPTLDNIHKKCRDLGREFEIIVVYMPFKDFGDPHLFEKRINSILEERKISWWVYPFVNWISRRLWRLCHQDADDRIIVFDYNSDVVELHGEAVMRHFGISEYPFSRKLLHSRELERLKAVTLESLLAYKSQRYVSLFHPGFTYSIPVSALHNRTVLLYLHCARDHSDNFFDQLISYCRTKVDDPDFEVVFVALDKTSFHNFGSSYGMPWLICPFNREHTDYVARRMFGKSGKFSTFAVFGKDGRLCSLHAQRLVCSSCLDFPFDDNLPEETIKLKLNHGKTYPLDCRNNCKALHPLLKAEYFFPDVPIVDSCDEDERNQYLISKIDCYSSVGEVVEYSDEIRGKIPNIDATNFDVVSFLSADNRNYLVRNDPCGTVFNIGGLRDKEYVMICCFMCPIYYKCSESLLCRAVSHVCYELYETYGDSFEMVLVLNMRNNFLSDESTFRHMLSGFHHSCLVVPFWDLDSRNTICCSLGFSLGSKGLFVRARERKVIWHKGLGYFTTYGKDTFPFTYEDFQKAREEERRISLNIQSLEQLFACSSAEVLSKNAGGGDLSKTTIEQLKETLVGVYVCSDGDSLPFVHDLYECCKANNIQFEIVVVYHPFNCSTYPELFQAQINRVLEKRKISWWELPFKSWVSLRLQRLLKNLVAEDLIIVGKGVADLDGTYFVNEFRKLDNAKLFPGCVPFGGCDPKQKIIDEFKSRYLAAT